MYQRTMFEDSDNATGLPASQDGVSPCDSLGGQTTEKFGALPAHALPFPSPAAAKAKRTKGIYGQSSLVSSPHDDLSALLASKLRAVTDLNGSTMYTLTWETVVTSSGHVLPRLAATARRTKDQDFVGWATPQATDYKSESATMEYRARRESHPRGKSLSEEVITAFVPWNTPRATDGSKGGPNQAGGALPADAALSAWSTPNVPNGGRTLTEEAIISRGQTDKGKRQVGLENEAKLTYFADAGTPNAGMIGSTDVERMAVNASDLSAWATPQARDHFPAHTAEYVDAKKAQGHGMRNLNDEARLTATGETPPGSGAEMGSTGQSKGQLNPRHAMWMQGFPQSWDECALAIPKTRKSTSRTRSRRKEKPACSDCAEPETQS